MVRSKGESERDFLHLVEQVKLEDKYFNYSRLEVANEIAANGVAELECEHGTSSENGPVDVPLRLYLKSRRKYWSAALMMHGIRVDGIDWLPLYPCEDGSPGSGWHRHRWNADDMNAMTFSPKTTAAQN
jgi:hypothetical protein